MLLLRSCVCMLRMRTSSGPAQRNKPQQAWLALLLQRSKALDAAALGWNEVVVPGTAVDCATVKAGYCLQSLQIYASRYLFWHKPQQEFDYSSNMSRGGHKIEQEDTSWESVWCDAPKAHRWGTGDERCGGESCLAGCLGNPHLTSIHVSIRRENGGLLPFHEDSISYHERSGDDCQPLFTVHFHYSFS